MKNNHISPQNGSDSELINEAARQAGIDGGRLREALNTGSVEGLVEDMNPKMAEKVKKLLANREATEKLLASEQAQSLMRKLTGK